MSSDRASILDALRTGGVRSNMNPNSTPFTPIHPFYIQLELLRLNALNQQQQQLQQLQQLQLQQQQQQFQQPLQQQHHHHQDQIPMTAALGGRFGSRQKFNQDESTGVISGGTSLAVPSKSDSAISWRRGTPPTPATPATTTSHKSRPVPLRFSPAVSQPLPVVVVDGSPTDDGYSSASSSELPLSPREEASKKLFEGLGIGRPSHSPLVSTPRSVSHPLRQPRGPPSGTDELGPHNFATRLRRKAIGGLGAALISARERREVSPPY
jgi:hypothetical protein